MPQTLRRPDGFASRRQTMGEMNVTPFIDVLLVLLIMLMLAIPIKTNTTEVDLPTGPGGEANPIANTVYISAADQLVWNGRAVNRDQLRANLETAAAMPKEPLLRFEPDAYASYDQSSRTIALIKDSGATKFAFIGNGQHKDFGR